MKRYRTTRITITSEKDVAGVHRIYACRGKCRTQVGTAINTSIGWCFNSLLSPVSELCDLDGFKTLHVLKRTVGNTINSNKTTQSYLPR